MSNSIVKASLPAAVTMLVLLGLLMYLIFTQKLTFTFLLIILLVLIVVSAAVDKYLDKHTSIISSRLEFEENKISYYKKSLRDGDVKYEFYSISNYKQLKDELTIYGDIEVNLDSGKGVKTDVCVIEGVIEGEALELIKDFRDATCEMNVKN